MGAQPSQADARCHGCCADKRRGGKSDMAHNQLTGPDSQRDTWVEGPDVQTRSNIHAVRADLARNLHNIGLQRRHVGKGKSAPERHDGDRCNEVGLRKLERHQHEGKSGLCCTNPVRDSSRESSMVAGWYVQTDTACLQDRESTLLQRGAQAPWFADDLV